MQCQRNLKKTSKSNDKKNETENIPKNNELKKTLCLPAKTSLYMLCATVKILL